MLPNKFVRINNKVTTNSVTNSEVRSFESFTVDDLLELVNLINAGVVSEKMKVLFLLTYDESRFYDLDEKLSYENTNLFLKSCFYSSFKEESVNYLFSSGIGQKVFSTNLISRLIAGVEGDKEVEVSFIEDFILIAYDFLSRRIEENGFYGMFVNNLSKIKDDKAENLLPKDSFSLKVLKGRVKLVNEIIFFYRTIKFKDKFDVPESELKVISDKIKVNIRGVMLESWVLEMVPENIFGFVKNEIFVDNKNDFNVSFINGEKHTKDGLVVGEDGIVRKPVSYSDLILNNEKDTGGISWFPVLLVFLIALVVWGSVFVPSSMNGDNAVNGNGEFVEERP